MKILVWIVGAILAALTAFMLLTAGWERPPIDATQVGFRGTGMVEVSNPRIAGPLLQQQLAQVPESLPPPPAGVGPTAGEIYQNVQLLGDLSVLEFNHLKQAWVDWIAPEQGCAYCHQLENMASDEVYTKVVARSMLQMNWAINEDWTTHVAETGVTCYTCHRGKNVPENVWVNADPAAQRGRGMLGWAAGQNRPAAEVGLTSLPWDPFSDLIEGNESIRVAGRSALPSGLPIGSMQTTERTYALMIHMSEALNVNCTYCHNSRDFSQWEESPAQRVTAWHGLEMVRLLNTDHVSPISSVLPPHRLGPTGEGQKINCQTCHAGVNKPLGGLSMLGNYPWLMARMNGSDHDMAAGMLTEAVMQDIELAEPMEAIEEDREEEDLEEEALVET